MSDNSVEGGNDTQGAPPVNRNPEPVAGQEEGEWRSISTLRNIGGMREWVISPINVLIVGEDNEVEKLISAHNAFFRESEASSDHVKTVLQKALNVLLRYAGWIRNYDQESHELPMTRPREVQEVEKAIKLILSEHEGEQDAALIPGSLVDASLLEKEQPVTKLVENGSKLGVERLAAETEAAELDQLHDELHKMIQCSTLGWPDAKEVSKAHQILYRIRRLSRQPEASEPNAHVLQKAVLLATEMTSAPLHATARWFKWKAGLVLELLSEHAPKSEGGKSETLGEPNTPSENAKIPIQKVLNGLRGQLINQAVAYTTLLQDAECRRDHIAAHDAELRRQAWLQASDLALEWATIPSRWKSADAGGASSSKGFSDGSGLPKAEEESSMKKGAP